MARTLDPSTNSLFSMQPFATPWTQEDAWHNVYSWINSQSNDSEGGDSIRSSTSSQPNASPHGSGYGFGSSASAGSGGQDDLTEHPLLCDAPASPFDPFDSSARPSPLLYNNQNFNFPQKQQQPSSQPTPAQATSDYSLIHELLKLNLGNNSSNPSPTHANSTLQFPSTSSPWSLPPDEPIGTYRPAPVAHRRDPLQPSVISNQHPQQNNSWRNSSSASPPSVVQMNNMFSNMSQPELEYFMQSQRNPAINAVAKVAIMKRSNAAIQLQSRLEEASEEYRQLEKERKQTEAELARHHLGKKISSSNGLPIPRLPTAPSRVDRLIVDFFREHARICTLLAKMEQLRSSNLPTNVHHALNELLEAVSVLQHNRNHERSAILQQLRGEAVRYDEEKESAALINALIVVRRAATRARAANWCSLVWTLGVEDELQQAQIDRLVAADFTVGPPPIRARPVKNAQIIN